MSSRKGSVPRIPQVLIDQLPDGPLRNLVMGGNYVISTEARDSLYGRLEKVLVHRPEFKALTTSTPDKGKAIVGWFFYKEAFAAALVERIVKQEGLTSSGRVLDPFGGIGTVPFVCQELGIPAVSVDLSPLPVFVANTKLTASRRNSAPELLELGARVVRAMGTLVESRCLPDVSIWEKAFDEEVAHALFNALDVIQTCRETSEFQPDVCDIAHLCLLCVAEEVSHAVKDGTSLRLRAPGRRLGRAGIKKSAQDLARQFNTFLQAMASDVRSFQGGLLQVAPEFSCTNEARVGDARRLASIYPPNTFDLVVTSPPYPNRYDYSAIYALELLLGFVPGREALRALRFDLFRSHLEAPWPTELRGLTPAVQEVLACLYQAGMSSPRVFKMILGYFADITETLRELHTVMKSGAAAYFVVGNVRIEGQEVPVDLILADIAQGIGFNLESVSIARLKGTNSQQSKRFGAGRLRESIVSFRKV